MESQCASESYSKVTYLLTVLLVDCVQRIFNCYAFHVARGNFEAEWEVEVDLLDWWSGEHLFEPLFLLDRAW